MEAFIDFKKTINLLKKLKDYHNISEIDIGALEPLLYQNSGKNIYDLIQAIEKIGLKVKITTNGSLLYKFAERFSNSNIEKIRISLHSINEGYFNTLTSSNKFKDVINSIKLSKKYNLPIEVNALMLKGHESEIMNVIKFADKYNIKLKIYNLYYAPFYRDDFKKYYLTDTEMINYFKDSLKVFDVETKKIDFKRNRTVLRLKNTEIIIKEDKNISRENKYCRDCKFKTECGEQFAEYIRIDPDFHFYPCYLRKDLKFSLNKEEDIKELNNFCKEIKIRLIVSAVCNFKCVFPDGSNNFWCLKQGGEYKWKGEEVKVSISDFI